MHATIIAIATILVAGAGISRAGPVHEATTYRQQIEKWRHDRVTRLSAPDGWLSLIGLDWLQPGVNKIGSAKDNDIVLSTGPAHLGTITLRDGRATIKLNADSDATIDGKHELESVLRDDNQDNTTVVAFGTTRFYLIRRDDKYGLRIKDSQAPTRTGFAGIDYFPIDPGWRIVAKWEPYDPPKEVEEGNVLGQVYKVTVPGAAVFERDGKTYRVEPEIEVPGDKNLFLVFADETSGKETYGAARFLYTDPPRDGKLVIDFNKAYNPPCAFTPYATCPLPWSQNRLKLRVTAGEKKYRKAAD